MPLSVEVHGTQIAPVISDNYTVDIQHRHDVKNEIISQEFWSQAGAAEIGDERLHRETGHVLARVNSGSYDDTFSYSKLRALLMVGDN